MSVSAPALENKIILLTGASRNIGYHLALLLAESGARLLLNARTVGALEQLDDEICQNGGIKPVLVPFNLSDFDKIDAMGAAIFERFGRLDGAVLNAAALDALMPLAHISPEKWQEILNVNLTANYRLIRSIDPLLRLAPRAALMGIIDKKPHAFWGHYHASKAGFAAFLECYQDEMKHSSIHVDCYCPHATDSKLRNAAYPGEDKSQLRTAEESAADIYQNFVKLYD